MTFHCNCQMLNSFCDEPKRENYWVWKKTLSHLFLCILYIVYTRWLPSLRFMYILNFEVQSNSYLGICCYLLKGVINDFDEQLLRGWWKSDSKLHKISKCQNNRNGGSLRNQKSNQIQNVFNQILQPKHLKMSGMISLSNFNDALY